jgi:hypothetical protein
VSAAFGWIARVDLLLNSLNQHCRSLGSPRQYDMRLLTERAALAGLTPGGTESCNRSCRLLQSRDGWVAVNLPRERDWQALPALLGRNADAISWAALAAAVRGMATSELVSSGRLLGVPIAAAIPAGAQQPASAPLSFIPAEFEFGRDRPRDWQSAPPLVVDLSALWAGPLCGHLLAACGARVIKVESVHRPDSIRHTSPAFFDLLNAGKESVALDFASVSGSECLRALVSHADLVISSARPRAFEQMDLAPGKLIESSPGLSWVAITAYGWQGENGNAVGFGDDVAVAAGLLSWPAGRPSFIGDAVADPLTGIAAAAAAIDVLGAGGGIIVDASLYAAARYVAGADLIESVASTDLMPPGTPQAPPQTVHARPFGADTLSVLRELT